MKTFSEQFDAKTLEAIERSAADPTLTNSRVTEIREQLQSELVDATVAELEADLAAAIDQTIEAERAGRDGLSPFAASRGRKSHRQL
jgi:hypothetical protein